VATVENVAVNAVMAGARPEHLGVIIGALQAMLQPAFNLAGLQATTNPAGPLTIVNGPIRQRLKLDSGGHAYSGGNNPNGPIGRAVRFVLRNVGESKGPLDRSTLGHPSKYSFCIAENEEESPWEPLHMSLGFAAAEDVVSAVAPKSIIDSCRPTFPNSEPLITDFCDVMKAVKIGSGTLLWVIPPAMAHVFAEDGYTRQSLQERLFQDSKSSRPFRREYLHQLDGGEEPPEGAAAGDVVERQASVTSSPADIYLLVAGGPAPTHAICLPGTAFSSAGSARVWAQPDDAVG
jgi:hypothetical protein